jgi:uncharacterized Zn-binding protein involved in type VI secretion
MGKPAARISDQAGHTGFIMTGASSVLIGGMPAARKGDSFSCPMPPHIGGVITMGSATVLIGGMPAARMGDPTGCNLAGTCAPGIPGTLGPPAVPAPAPEGSGAPDTGGSFDAQHGNNILNSQTDYSPKYNGGVSGPHAEYIRKDNDKDGTYDTFGVEAHAVRFRNRTGSDGKDYLGASHEMDVLYGNASATSSAGYGYGASAQAEAGMVTQGGSVFVGPKGDQGRNAVAGVAGKYDIMHAKAEGDYLLGDDGRRVGMGAKVSAKAEAVSADGTGTLTTPSVFGVNLQGKAKVGVSAGAAGAGAGAGIYWDKVDKRFFVKLDLGLKVLFGLETEMEFSIGEPFKGDDPAPAPAAPAPPAISPCGGIAGVVISGFSNVIIGG